MKKLFFSALIAVSMVSSAFAADITKVNKRVVNAFSQDYHGALGVEWVAKPEFVKASFLLENKKVDVFYNHSGERIGTSFNITMDELPLSAKRAFAKKYAGYTVKEAIQFERNDEVAYFLTAENASDSLILEVKGGQISIYKRNK